MARVIEVLPGALTSLGTRSWIGTVETGLFRKKQRGVFLDYLIWRWADTGKHVPMLLESKLYAARAARLHKLETEHEQ